MDLKLYLLIHVLYHHVGRYIAEYGQLMLFANFGLESTHQLNKQIVTRMTNRNKTGNIDSQVLKHAISLDELPNIKRKKKSILETDLNYPLSNLTYEFLPFIQNIDINGTFLSNSAKIILKYKENSEVILKIKKRKLIDLILLINRIIKRRELELTLKTPEIIKINRKQSKSIVEFQSLRAFKVISSHFKNLKEYVQGILIAKKFMSNNVRNIQKTKQKKK